MSAIYPCCGLFWTLQCLLSQLTSSWLCTVTQPFRSFGIRQFRLMELSSITSSSTRLIIRMHCLIGSRKPAVVCPILLVCGEWNLWSGNYYRFIYECLHLSVNSWNKGIIPVSVCCVYCHQSQGKFCLDLKKTVGCRMCRLPVFRLMYSL